MPCRDYMDDHTNWSVANQDLKERCDKLSRIACKALQHIEESADGLEILILKDPEIQEWWSAHKEADRVEKEKKIQQEAIRQEKLRLKKIKEETLKTLTAEQKKALGLK